MNQPSPALAERDLRQRDLIAPEKLRGLTVTVVGVGAIGRQAALQLAATGVGALTLIDPDTVEPVNLAPQMYLEEDLGRPKVEATRAACLRLNSGVCVRAVPARFRRSDPPAAAAPWAVFACVDSIDTRRHLFEAVGEAAGLFVDGRMAAEALRVLVATPRRPGTVEAYRRSLFAGSEAFAGPCTARSTAYGAALAAALMVAQLSKWLRGLPLEADQTVNLLAGEWSVAAAPAGAGGP